MDMNGEQSKLVPETSQEAIEQLVVVNRIIANEGILDALGHISVRNPENRNTFFQAISISPFEVTRDSIVEIDFEGNPITIGAFRLYGERMIHAAILEARPDMNAVFHGHYMEVIPFSITDIPIRPVLHVGSFLYQGVPVYDEYEPGGGMLIRTGEEGKRIARHLGQCRVQLLRGHGCNIVAENLARLVASAVYLKNNAMVQWQLVLAGKEPKYISPEEAKPAMEKALFGINALERMWAYWVARVKRNMPDMKDWK
jgi:3-hydroxy-2-methylpyridine-4,5-dicarboxylate 4-decarboxylase